LFSIKNADELKKAYYKLMMIHHPDKAGDTDENKIIAQYINDVYFELKEKL
jgi:DnaJ-class molecular chaperone